MKRVLCLRLLNWPIQRLQRRLTAKAIRFSESQRRTELNSRTTNSGDAVCVHGVEVNSGSSRIAIHTSPTGTVNTTERKPKLAADQRFLREIFPSARGGPAIVGASASAWRQGIRPGIPLAEARSMIQPIGRQPSNAEKAVSETEFYEWDPAGDRADLIAIAELTRQFAPVVALDDVPMPDCLLLDITGCGQLFGGESALAEQLMRQLKKEQLSVRLTISDSVATAWAFAHPTGHFILPAQRIPRRQQSNEWETPIQIIPPGQSAAWLCPLPIAAARLPVADCELLSHLGILNIQQLTGLPLEDLPSRLSPTAILRIRQLTGIDNEILTPLPEADPIRSSWASEYPAENAAEIQQVLKQLISAICEQLSHRYVGAVRVTCWLSGEDKSRQQTLVAETVQPVQDTDALLEVLTLQLERFQLAAPAYSITAEAGIAPLPIGRQRDLFSTDAHVRPTEELATVINRISNRLGSDTVLRAARRDSSVPEKSIQAEPLIDSDPDAMQVRLDDLVTPDAHSLPSSGLTRPVRLHSAPIPLKITKLTCGMTLPLNGRNRIVTSIEGPERIQTDWWCDSPVHRDYFRVRLDNEALVWMFMDLGSENWFLHGTFD